MTPRNLREEGLFPLQLSVVCPWGVVGQLVTLWLEGLSSWQLDTLWASEAN